MQHSFRLENFSTDLTEFWRKVAETACYGSWAEYLV